MHNHNMNMNTLYNNNNNNDANDYQSDSYMSQNLGIKQIKTLNGIDNSPDNVTELINDALEALNLD